MDAPNGPTMLRFSQLLANVENLRKRCKTIEESDPELGEQWKAGMLRHWGSRLMEATVRAREYAEELGLDPDAAVAIGR